jgi:Tol biopolymer transport system component
MDRPMLAGRWHAGQTSRSHHASRFALGPFRSGALAATAGALVAVGLLVLTMLLVVGPRPARAVDSGGAFNVTDNTTDDFSPSYSPSGQKIAYRVGPSDSDGTRTPNDIYTINADGTGRLNLTDNKRGERDPYYSPDGQRIAYAGYDGEQWDIYIIDADGGGRARLTDDAANELEISWSPDGKKIAYEYHQKRQDKEIYTIGLGRAHRVVQITHNARNDTDPTFSPDSQKIAYAHDDGQDKEIYTIKADGERRGTRLTDNTVDDTELCWSPDGTKIAFKATEVAHTASVDVDRDLEIYTIGTGPAHRVDQVTHNRIKDGEPSYSGDGSKLAYEGQDGQDPGKDKEIYTIPSPDPSAQRRF